MISARALLVPLVFATAPLAAAQPPVWPFGVGESLEYQVRVSRFGDVGTGRMWVEGPEQIGDVASWRLRFELDAGKGPIRASDQTSSWIDPRTLTTLRFEKRERHLLSRSDERVIIDRPMRQWIDEEGGSGDLATDAPLDELSFMYFLRTLSLDRDTTLRFDRHFDAARNPTLVRVLGLDTLITPAGTFQTRIVEMDVRDPKRYKGTGIIRIHFSTAACHTPIQIESRMPLLGATILTLSGWSHPPLAPGATRCGR